MKKTSTLQIPTQSYNSAPSVKVPSLLTTSHFSFSTKKSLTESPEIFLKLIQILQKAPYQKSKNEQQFLRNILCQLEFFQKLEHELGEEETKNIYKQLKYKQIPKFQPVFKQGDIGDCFYILVRGKVTVLKCSEDCVKQRNIPQQTMQQKRKHKKKEMLSDDSFEDEDEDEENDDFEVVFNNEKEYLQLYHPDCVKLQELDEGESFGEIALKENVPRQATVVTTQSTHLITLIRYDFERFLTRYYNLQTYNKVEQIKNIPFLKHIPEYQIMNMVYDLSEKTFYFNQYVYKQEGEVETIYKNDNYNSNNFYLVGKSKSIPSIMNNTARQSTQQKTISVCKIQKGGHFGDEEILHNQKRKYSVICISSEVKLFVMLKRTFLSMIKDKSIEYGGNKTLNRQEIRQQLLISNSQQSENVAKLNRKIQKENKSGKIKEQKLLHILTQRVSKVAEHNSKFISNMVDNEPLKTFNSLVKPSLLNISQNQVMFSTSNSKHKNSYIPKFTEFPTITQNTLPKTLTEESSPPKYQDQNYLKIDQTPIQSINNTTMLNLSQYYHKKTKSQFDTYHHNVKNISHHDLIDFPGPISTNYAKHHNQTQSQITPHNQDLPSQFYLALLNNVDMNNHHQFNIDKPLLDLTELDPKLKYRTEIHTKNRNFLENIPISSRIKQKFKLKKIKSEEWMPVGIQMDKYAPIKL